jgi:hypothetical protein
VQAAEPILAKPQEFADIKDWAVAFTRDLEDHLSQLRGHVKTVPIAKSQLPKAKQAGIIITITDDAVLGKCQVYSNGTTWLRMIDNLAIDAAMATHVNSIGTLGAGEYTGIVDISGTGAAIVTNAGSNTINVHVPVVDPSPDRTHVGTTPNHLVGNPEAILTGYGAIAIVGAAAGGKLFRLSSYVQLFMGSTIGSSDLVNVNYRLGPLGTLADPVVANCIQKMETGIAATSGSFLALPSKEVQTTSTSDKLTIGIWRNNAAPPDTIFAGLLTPCWVEAVEVM